MVDGAKQTDMPTSPLASNGSYYKVDVSCTSSKTKGLWDYNAWRLNLDYIESNSKCTLTFTSSMSKTDYDKYIQAGIALRRNTYRGKDITSYYNGTKVNGRDLYGQISNGTFDDIYVGDYFTGTTGIIWLIADIDNYLNQGDTSLTKHHATIIPAGYLEKASMNKTDTSEGGYAGSTMVKTTLNTILTNKITPDFKNHILSYSNYLTNEIDKDSSNMYGSTHLGASSNWSWINRQVDLMSEVNVFGTTIWSSSGYDIGLDNRQYAIFQLKPEFISQDLFGNRYWYWLKAVTSASGFAYVGSNGDAGSELSASNTDGGIRPRFLID